MTESALKAKKNLIQFIEDFQPVIEEFFKSHKHIDKEFGALSLFNYETFEEQALRDAKRLRASFVNYVYGMLNGTNPEEAMKASIAIELFHSSWLVIDDFQDISDSRRGGKTGHIMVKEDADNKSYKGDHNHLGNSMAVLQGLLGVFMASEIINTLNVDSEIRQRALTNINTKMYSTAHGQINDIYNTVLNSLEEVDIDNVLMWKTAMYTYENPIHLGAILAGGTKNDLDILSLYAIPAGVAFQIQDDILGMFGDENRTGKSNMDDLKEGKMTLLIYKALEEASKSQKEVIEKALGNRELSSDLHAKVQEIIVETGSLEYSKVKATALVTKAKNQLEANKVESWSSIGYEYLIGIADYMIERDL